MNLINKSVALVTGGSQGLGKAVVSALLELGGNVSFLDINKDQGEEVQKSLLEKYGEGRSLFIPCDVSKEQELRDAFNKTKTTFGNINIVCNNAGVCDKRNMNEIVKINLQAMMQGTFLGIEHMSSQHGNEGGVVINVSSQSALEVHPPCLAIYSATKAGVVHFTRSMERVSETDGVRVVCFCPSGIKTPLLNAIHICFPELKEQVVLSVPFVPLEPDDATKDIVKLVLDKENAGKVYEFSQSNRGYVQINRVLETQE